MEEQVVGFQVTPEVRFKQPLGEGGMGSLWVADHLTMQTEVAVKLVFMDLAANDPTILTRFHREANMLIKLDSPHVVKIYDRGKTPAGTPFIVMELLRGETLLDRLERKGEMSPAEISVILHQLTVALEYLRSVEVTHRDLKAENVFLVGNEMNPLVKLLDFGLAKEPDAPGDKKLTGVGMLVGTAEYMSPEQIISAKDVNHTADLWAMAVLIYMMLVAAKPFEGEQLGEVFMAIRTGKHVPPSAHNSALVPFDAWFARCFDIDYNKRFQSAREMNEAWQQLIAGPQLPAQPPPAVPPLATAPAGDSNVLLIGIIGTVVALGLMVIFMLLLG